jgi:hypothetical protein
MAKKKTGIKYVNFIDNDWEQKIINSVKEGNWIAIGRRISFQIGTK